MTMCLIYREHRFGYLGLLVISMIDVFGIVHLCVSFGKESIPLYFFAKIQLIFHTQALSRKIFTPPFRHLHDALIKRCIVHSLKQAVPLNVVWNIRGHRLWIVRWGRITYRGCLRCVADGDHLQTRCRRTRRDTGGTRLR